ncbi:MAG: Ig-like domain-containing protein [Cytophagaceae bacterium]|jgi:uncharacterized protein YjdB|nr:Ig-like domain-containing protein [Cytophagaceae bacterium]
MRKLSIILCGIVMCTAMNSAMAQTTGTTGALTWTLDGSTLTISGEGDMLDYSNSARAPWSSLNFSDAVIENGVTRIGSYAFAHSSVSSIVIPETVASMGTNLLDWCMSISEITCWRTTPPTAPANMIDIYSVNLPNITLKVPAGSGDNYATATGWKVFTNIEEIIIPVTGVTVTPEIATLEPGEVVELEATIEPANAANKTIVWSSNNAVATVENGVVTAISAGNAIITATTEDGNKTATCAVKVLDLFTVTLEATPAEGGDVTGDGNYVEGKSVTVTATANTGYEFVNWTEDGEEVSADAVFNFTAEANRNLVANFVLKSYTVTVSSTPSEGGDALGTGAYVHGDEVTVTAIAKTGYVFVNWTENDATVSADAEYKFNVTGNRILVANFALAQFNVIFDAPQNGTLTVTANNEAIESGAVVDYNTVLTIFATPANGYEHETLKVNSVDFVNGSTHTIIADVQIECTFKKSAGINNSTIANVTVYGNGNSVYIVNKNNVSLKSVLIADLNGRTVYQGTASTSVVIPVNEASGIYIVTLVSDDNKVSSAKVHLKR